MKLPLVTVGLLPLLVTCCTTETCCTKDTLLSLDSDLTGVQYRDACTHTNSVEEFSVCVTQRNSLQYLLGCANNEQGRWVIPVGAGGGLDNDIHSGITSYNIAEDGSITVTAKELLRNVAGSSVCENYLDLDLASIFRRCPFKDTQTFLNCLCCERVEDYHIQGLHDCLAAHNPTYAVPRALNMPVNWLCRGTCVTRPLVKNNKCPTGTFADVARDGKKICKFWRNNKGPVVPTRVRPRAYNHGETDEDEVSVSDLDPTQFSNFPDVTWSMSSTAAASRTRTASASPLVTTGLSSAFAEGTGKPTLFATPEPSPPPSSSPTAASGDSSAGVGYKGADHVLLGWALAVAGILFRVA